MASRSTAVVGRATVEADASVHKSGRLALNPEEVAAPERHREIKWVPVAEWNKHPRPRATKAVRTAPSAAFPFNAVFTLQTISLREDGSRVRERDKAAPG
jgi:hypothetical protein